MRSLLNKIFANKLGVGKFILAGFAFLIGLTLVLLSVQIYFKIQDFLNPKQNLSGYLLLNKEVGIGNTLFGSKASFSSEDIEELKTQDFVEDLGTFQSSNFHVRAFVGGDIGFQTELFFESVDDKFIDDKPYNFKWSEGDGFLPIIISQDFLNLYNFGYALGRGTPQLSKSTISFVPLKVEVSGPNGSRVFDAKVVGFSERIPSVLAPKAFVTWANKTLAGSKTKSISRVIVKVKGDKASLVEPYLETKSLKISEDKLKLSRISNLVTIVMSILFFIGSAFLLFALVIVLLNFSLILAEAKHEVKLLLQIGYKKSTISKHLITYLSLFILIVSLTSLGLFYTLNKLFINLLADNGIDIQSTIEVPVFITGIVFILCSYLLSIIFIIKMLKKSN